MGRWQLGFRRGGGGGHDAHRQRYKLLRKKASSCRSVGVVESKKELIAFVGLFRAPGMMVRKRERKKRKREGGAAGEIYLYGYVQSFESRGEGEEYYYYHL
jgi:hypothetical protein